MSLQELLSERETCDRYTACMVLGGVGDALGYRNGEWEFCFDGEKIHKAAKELGGIDQLSVTGLSVSDDTVMHIATAEALDSVFPGPDTFDMSPLFEELALQYVLSFEDMSGRAPGGTTRVGVARLQCRLDELAETDRSDPYAPLYGPWRTPVPRSPTGGGCGGCMRAVPIGLAFPFANASPHDSQDTLLESIHEQDLLQLIAVSVESCRMTHRVPVTSWGANLLAALPKVAEYLAADDSDGNEDVEDMAYFTDTWSGYLKMRGILEGEGPATFPEVYGVKERDAFYSSVSRDGWGGASGHDAPLIAYDALLGAEGRWGGEDGIIARGVLHAGDNDSTGIIACSWHGALYGWSGIPDGAYGDLEYELRMREQGRRLWAAASSRRFTRRVQVH